MNDVKRRANIGVDSPHSLEGKTKKDYVHSWEQSKKRLEVTDKGERWQDGRIAGQLARSGVVPRMRGRDLSVRPSDLCKGIKQKAAGSTITECRGGVVKRASCTGTQSLY